MGTCGKIIEIKDHHYIIEPTESAQCGKCMGCGKKHSGKKTIKLPSDERFKVGDGVIVEFPEKMVIFTFFLLYILPLVGFFVGYALSTLVFSLQSLTILSAFIFCGITFVLIRIFEKKLSFILTRNSMIIRKK